MSVSELSTGPGASVWWTHHVTAGSLRRWEWVTWQGEAAGGISPHLAHLTITLCAPGGFPSLLSGTKGPPITVGGALLDLAAWVARSSNLASNEKRL